MSFQLGLAQIIAVALLVIVARRKIFQKEIIFFLGVLSISIFLMVDEPLIIPIWNSKIPIQNDWQTKVKPSKSEFWTEGTK